MTKPRPGALVRLYPTSGPEAGTVPGVPPVEQDVPPERAAELLAHRPPAFATDPPAAADDDSQHDETEAT